METNTRYIAQVEINKPDPLPDPGLTSATVKATLTYAFLILLGLSILMITLQGMRYALSMGESDKVAQARKGIIYSLVGVVVAVSGVTLTQFVLGQVLPAGADTQDIPSLLERIVGLIGLVTGVISSIMVIIGGYKYVLSTGDSSKTASARQTILYAMIGMVIAAIGTPIAFFVLSRVQ